MKRVHYAISIAAILVLSALGLSLYGYHIKNTKIRQEEYARQERIDYIARQKQFSKATFANLSLQADAVLVQNLATNEIVYEQGSDRSLPLASLAKIMTAIAALEFIDKRAPVTFSKAAIAQIGDQGFFIGEQIPLEELIPFMLVTSSNDAGYAIAETVEKSTGVSFVTSMNELSASLGFDSFLFKNPTGLDDVSAGVHASATGNASDVAGLLLYATQTYPEYFKPSAAAVSRVQGHKGINTNTLTNSIPGFLSSKTGFTATAGGNLAFIVEIGPNQPYAVVVMGSSFEGRFTDAKKIINALYTVVGGMPADL